MKIAIYGNRYYKLLPTKGAPTLEIDGIRMHRTKNTTPEKDAKDKINVLGINHGIVLDTCMGLGYTAIEAINNGANKVITIELEPYVIRISEMNPWSQKLFNEPEIHMILSDSYHLLDSMEELRFNFIIHDPPRQRSSGHLYSKTFYEKLYRVLKHGGKLFHYTGEPRSRYRNVNIPRGVSKRLRTVGFKKIKYHKQVLGYSCQK
jgi:hypothetical protein